MKKLVYVTIALVALFAATVVRTKIMFLLSVQQIGRGRGCNERFYHLWCMR